MRLALNKKERGISAADSAAASGSNTNGAAAVASGTVGDEVANGFCLLAGATHARRMKRVTANQYSQVLD